MALRAGRVGVNPADVNPIDGHIIPIISDNKTIIGRTSEGKNIYRETLSVTVSGSPYVWLPTGVTRNATLYDIKGVGRTGSGDIIIYPIAGYFTSEHSLSIMHFRDNFTIGIISITIEYIENEESISTLSED